MRIAMAILTLGIIGAGYTAPARAIGCISGGIAGAVAGHMANHGVLGAIGGCIAGHEYNKHQKARALEQQNSGQTDVPLQNGSSNQPPVAGSRNTY